MAIRSSEHAHHRIDRELLKGLGALLSDSSAATRRTTLRGASLVSVMKTTDLGNGDDCSGERVVRWTMIRGVFGEAKMRAPLMVVIHVGLEGASKVCLADDDHVTRHSRGIEPISRSI
jgi:hypothetical protein